MSQHPGLWDVYCHTLPCLIPRWGSALDVARSAVELGFAGVVLQSHHEATTARAQLAQQCVSTVTVVGGLTLNGYCGGISPRTVRAHLKAGAGVVWLPTTDAAAHAAMLGGTGRSLSGAFDSRDVQPTGISILDDRHDLRAEVLEIIDEVAAAGAVLCTGHISFNELDALVRAAVPRGAKLVISHPYFLASPPPEWWRSLPRDGVWVQFAAVDDPAVPRLPRIEQVVETLRLVGAHRCVLGSEARAPTHPLRQVIWFCERLRAMGVPAADVEELSALTPQRLFASDDRRPLA